MQWNLCHPVLIPWRRPLGFQEEIVQQDIAGLRSPLPPHLPPYYLLETEEHPRQRATMEFLALSESDGFNERMVPLNTDHSDSEPLDIGI